MPLSHSGNTKIRKRTTAVLKLLGQGNNVKVEKADLTLVPKGRGILLGASCAIGTVHLLKQALVPLTINLNGYITASTGEKTSRISGPAGDFVLFCSLERFLAGPHNLHANAA